MYILKKDDEVNYLINVTKSNSGISGPELARAHIRLGELMGNQIRDFVSDDTTVIAMLRGGIFFAQGLYFSLGCKFETYDPKREEFKRPNSKDIILVDSVINTGNTIKKIIGPDMHVACCVINEKAVDAFEKQLFAVRISSNSFVGKEIAVQQGKVGPDTTMRLFNQI